MKKVSLLFISSILLVSCSGIDKQPGATAYGPVNSENQYGEASYTRGWPSVESQRRQDTYKKMYEACNGKYKIIKEEERYQTINFKFECVN
ncbi:Uncharacterised protein [Raoultella planticola]|uniref:hypothetical protein n=1 Tax=Raoultella planticola TaxID=575 RepID=UPI0010D286A5|nr:hypothetical protein [Raoultella planticola]VTM99758.1 Uncharacterised protein [Raoultella planticola]